MPLGPQIHSLSLDTVVGLLANSIALPCLRNIEFVGSTRAIGLLFTHRSLSRHMHMAVYIAIHWPRLAKEVERRVISCMADWLQLCAKPGRTIYLRYDPSFVGHVTGSVQDGADHMFHLVFAAGCERLRRISFTMLCEVLQLSEVWTLRISGCLLRNPSHETMTRHPFVMMQNAKTLCLHSVPSQRVTELLGATRTEPYGPRVNVFHKLRHIELCEIDLADCGAFERSDASEALHELCDALAQCYEYIIGSVQISVRDCMRGCAWSIRTNVKDLTFGYMTLACTPWPGDRYRDD